MSNLIYLRIFFEPLIGNPTPPLGATIFKVLANGYGEPSFERKNNRNVFMIMVISCNTRDKMYSFFLGYPNSGIPVAIISIISTPCEVDYTGPVVRLVAV